MARFVLLTHYDIDGRPRGDVWVNPEHVTRVLAQKAGGAIVELFEGSVVRVAESAELAALMLSAATVAEVGA